MTVDFWTVFWTVLLLLALALFAGLAVVVTVGGFYDARRLFRSIVAKHDEQERETGSNES